MINTNARVQGAYAEETRIGACGDTRVIMRPWMNKSLSFGILGLFLVALGNSLCFLWPTVFHQILQKVSAKTMIIMFICDNISRIFSHFAKCFVKL